MQGQEPHGHEWMGMGGFKWPGPGPIIDPAPPFWKFLNPEQQRIILVRQLDIQIGVMKEKLDILMMARDMIKGGMR